MSDPVVSTIERDIDGTKWKFKKLSPRDRSTILRRLMDERRPKFLATLEKGGVTGEKYVNEVDAFDAMPLGIDDLVRYINRPEGTSEILDLGYKKANPTAPDDAMDGFAMEAEDAKHLAFDVACIKVVFFTPGSGDTKTTEEQPANRPLEPASSSQ